MSYQHQRVNSIKSCVHKHERKPFCGFCKNLGKTKSECAHSIKGCIVLKNNECRYCHDLGHTKNRCPKLKAKSQPRRGNSLKRPRVTPRTIGCGAGWEVVSKRMKNQDTIHRLQKKQRVVKRQEIRSNKFAALEEEDDRDFNGPKVVTTDNELKGAWAKSLSSNKSVTKPVVVEEKKVVVKALVKEMTHLLTPKYIGAWADAVSSDDESSDDEEEEIVLDSYGRPTTDNSAW